MSMELVMWAAPVELPQKIENFEEIKTYLTEATAKYRDLVITSEEVKPAERELADLRKLRDFIDTQRKEAKKQYTERLKPLEEQYKELAALVIAPINAIDTQVKEFREVEKKAKYDELKAYFDMINDVSFLKFDRVLDPKYGNKTVKMDTLKTELAFAVKKVADDYDEITALYKDAPYLVAVQNKFAETLEKDTALAYAAVLERQTKAKSVGNAAPGVPPTENTVVAGVPDSQVQAEKTVGADVPDSPEHSASEPLKTGRFEVTGTRAQIQALGAFMRAQGITFKITK